MCKVIICDLDHADVEPEERVLAEAGYGFKWLRCKSQGEVIENCRGAVVLLNQYIKMDRVIFEALPSVKCVVRYGVGFDNIDLADATKHGVQACNVPDYCTNEVADQALAHIMSLLRKTTLSNNIIRRGVWDFQKLAPIPRLSDATVGICGLGRIGSALAQRLRPLCREAIAFDVEQGVAGRSFPDFVRFVTFAELLARSDVLSVHCPLNESSYHLFGKDEFFAMRDNAYFINVSRGGIVDEGALLDALRSGKIAGAALDVAESEPLSVDNPLLALDNFSVSPHSAWYSEQSAKDLKRKAAEEAVRFLRHGTVKYPVNTL
uniref:D-3-phosphoglycerate dehydrogenase n=1 Tax=uncultured bacterium contig00097 TaxID=1181566 RepID=A0A806KGC6_9BACT|nr:D-3-phosphoglycerate dehydrogenase [uncultured bacterium contig00097]